jgi:hypothetical protein
MQNAQISGRNLTDLLRSERSKSPSPLATGRRICDQREAGINLPVYPARQRTLNP